MFDLFKYNSLLNSMVEKLKAGSAPRMGKHKTRQSGSYFLGQANRPGTKLVRRFYGEAQAERYNGC